MTDEAVKLLREWQRIRLSHVAAHLLGEAMSDALSTGCAASVKSRHAYLSFHGCRNKPVRLAYDGLHWCRAHAPGLFAADATQDENGRWHPAAPSAAPAPAEAPPTTSQVLVDPKLGFAAAPARDALVRELLKFAHDIEVSREESVPVNGRDSELLREAAAALAQLSPPPHDELGAWVAERLANSERIAATKSGEDRDGWLEDVAYWRAIATAVARRQPAHDPLIAELQTRYTAAQGVPVEGHPDHPAVRAWDTAIWRAFPKIAAALAQRDVPRAEPERVAQLIAHRACVGAEHDPQNGKLHGCCVVCGTPWPCEYAAPQERSDVPRAELAPSRWDDPMYDAQERSDAQRDDDARDAAMWRTLMNYPKARKRIWDHVLGDEHKADRNTIEEVLAAMQEGTLND